MWIWTVNGQLELHEVTYTIGVDWQAGLSVQVPEGMSASFENGVMRVETNSTPTPGIEVEG